MKNQLDILSEIQKLEAPPFLLPRVLQQIENIRADRLPPKLAWSLALSLLLVVALNISVVIHSAERESKKATVSLTELLPDNRLYHE